MKRLNRLISVGVLIVFSTTGMSALGQRRTSRRTRRGAATQHARLTGTYRLDTSRSDNPRDAAERATRNLPAADQQSAIDSIVNRLESPDVLAIERHGRTITIASSRAPKFTFIADGQERMEQTDTGVTVRARATINGSQLVVSSTGDRDKDFSVTFDPLEKGQRLSVQRRIYTTQIGQPVIVQSFYNKTSEVAQWSVYGGSPAGTGSSVTATRSKTFIVPNDTRLVAVLNDSLSTKQSHERDKFTMTVREPALYEGATIDGYVSRIGRSGKISGRSEMTLNFREIRLRDGRSYRFAGLVESVRTNGEQSVRVDNEGDVQSGSQTKKTEERAAIGTGVGAIIGAIAGGGKGAAIGAIVGAGTGAGSVYAQGRQDLELRSGTEVTIRASAPRNEVSGRGRGR
jgi:hypothetical protein